MRWRLWSKCVRVGALTILTQGAAFSEPTETCIATMCINGSYIVDNTRGPDFYVTKFIIRDSIYVYIYSGNHPDFPRDKASAVVTNRGIKSVIGKCGHKKCVTEVLIDTGVPGLRFVHGWIGPDVPEGERAIISRQLKAIRITKFVRTQ